jgi:hypothetical protein
LREIKAIVDAQASRRRVADCAIDWGGFLKYMKKRRKIRPGFERAGIFFKKIEYKDGDPPTERGGRGNPDERRGRIDQACN